MMFPSVHGYGKRYLLTPTKRETVPVLAAHLRTCDLQLPFLSSLQTEFPSRVQKKKQVPIETFQQGDQGVSKPERFICKESVGFHVAG